MALTEKDTAFTSNRDCYHEWAEEVEKRLLGHNVMVTVLGTLNRPIVGMLARPTAGFVELFRGDGRTPVFVPTPNIAEITHVVDFGGRRCQMCETERALVEGS